MFKINKKKTKELNKKIEALAEDLRKRAGLPKEYKNTMIANVKAKLGSKEKEHTIYKA